MLALLCVPAFAYDDPKALVAAIYAPYQKPGAAAKQDPAQFYSERLKGLVAKNAARATNDLLDRPRAGDTGPVAPALAFNPFIAAQHSLLVDLTIADPVVLGRRAVVTVSFHNFDQASLISLALVEEMAAGKSTTSPPSARAKTGS